MNVLILGHERSLNKTETLINALLDYKIYLVTDNTPADDTKQYSSLINKIIISKNFDIVDIIKKLPKNIDIIYCVSENLLPLQSQLESFFNIKNITPFAAEILSNKQKLDDYCKLIGLNKYIPLSITPTFHKQLEIFGDNEIFSKPDIGTGSNIFYPGDDPNAPNIEYRRWNNRHHFLKHLKDKQIHNDFFDYNKSGIYSKRFNYKQCKIMFQEYFWSTKPSVSPYGYIFDGKVNILFYVKNSKIKYGDLINPTSNPIESHSVSKNSDIVRERAVWIAMPDEIEFTVQQASNEFLQTIVDNLKIKNMFFAGPDFHITENNRLIAIDFNPRPGQFINILDKINNFEIMKNIISNKQVTIQNKVLWGCAVLKPGIIKKVQNYNHIATYFNIQNTKLTEGTIIPQFQNLQNKTFNFNLNISGENEQELFNKYIKVNQLLQDCIVYKD